LPAHRRLRARVSVHVCVWCSSYHNVIQNKSFRTQQNEVTNRQKKNRCSASTSSNHATRTHATHTNTHTHTHVKGTVLKPPPHGSLSLPAPYLPPNLDTPRTRRRRYSDSLCSTPRSLPWSLPRLAKAAMWFTHSGATTRVRREEEPLVRRRGRRDPRARCH
jgi:hypothetical protein